MDLSYRKKITKTIIYILIIAAAAIIQSTEGLAIEIGGARCFLLLPVTIILSMGEDEGFAGLLGLTGGLFWDLTSSVHLGFNAAFLCIICFCCAASVTYIIRNTFISNFVFSAFSAFLYSFLYWLFFIIIKGVHGAELSLFSFYFPSAVFTMLVTPLIWIIVVKIKRRLNGPVRL
ncbi:MAG: rod shape-determining protein MreD [Eubacterium sp.]